MSSTATDVAHGCPCECHVGRSSYRPTCTCTCPRATSSSPPVVYPLTARVLAAAGRHLIRWRAMTFYRDSLPSDQKKTIDSDIKTAAAAIRAELGRVNAVDAWQQYTSELSRASARSSNSAKSSLDDARGRLRLNAFLRRFSPASSSSSSSVTLVSDGASSPASTVADRPALAAGCLRKVFDAAAERLRVSRSQLELAFKYYAHHLAFDRGVYLTARGVVEERRFSALAEVILMDMDDFAMSGAARRHDVTGGMLACDSLASLFSTEATSPSPLGGGGVQRQLLGRNYALVIQAITVCTERYFHCLRYKPPPTSRWRQLRALLVERRKDKKSKGREEGDGLQRWRIKWHVRPSTTGGYQADAVRGHIRCEERREGAFL